MHYAKLGRYAVPLCPGAAVGRSDAFAEPRPIATRLNLVLVCFVAGGTIFQLYGNAVYAIRIWRAVNRPAVADHAAPAASLGVDSRGHSCPLVSQSSRQRVLGTDAVDHSG